MARRRVKVAWSSLWMIGGVDASLLGCAACSLRPSELGGLEPTGDLFWASFPTDSRENRASGDDVLVTHGFRAPRASSMASYRSLPLPRGFFSNP
jgi:hypothetical protein